MERLQKIKQQIRDSFGVHFNVPFPKHLRINSAIAMDDWVSDPDELMRITKDKDLNGKWWEIPVKEFEYMFLASCYFDSYATELYLPAYMIVV